LGNAHGFRIKGLPVKYDTLKDAVADANKFATFKDAYIVVYGKSKQGVVRKKKRSKSVRRSAQIHYDEAGRLIR
jgi:hypothetical protein